MGELLQGFGQGLLEGVLPTLGTVIAGLLVGILARYLKKVGLELTTEQEQRLRELASDAIRAAEERARRTSTLEVPVSGAAKHAEATAILQARVPWLKEGTASKLVDAMLPAVRAQIEEPTAVLVPPDPAQLPRRDY